jgi:hypothetical protein
MKSSQTDVSRGAPKSKEALLKQIDDLRNDLQRSLNNVYIWTSYSIKALEEARKDQEFLLRGNLLFPPRLSLSQEKSK